LSEINDDDDDDDCDADCNTAYRTATTTTTTTTKCWLIKYLSIYLLLLLAIERFRWLRREHWTVCHHRSGPRRHCCRFGGRQRPISFGCRIQLSERSCS